MGNSAEQYLTQAKVGQFFGSGQVHPDVVNVPKGVNSLQFAEFARRLALVTRSFGVTCPSFRCPPQDPKMVRALRRNSDGSITIAVAIRGRLPVAVLADMIDGVVVANNLECLPGSKLRDQIWMQVFASEETADLGSELVVDEEDSHNFLRQVA